MKNRIVDDFSEASSWRKKHLHPDGLAWSAVLAATGQPERFE